MRILIAMMMGCALLFGFANSASSQRIEPATTTENATQAPDDTDTAYECKHSPYCQRASQCTAYCAGGAPVCFNGCCACAS